MLINQIKKILRSLLPANMIRQLVAISIKIRRTFALEQRVCELERKVLVQAYPGLAKVGPRERLKALEARIHSQNGEDGLTLAFLSKIPVHGAFVEVGVEDGRECNSAVLSLDLGWRGLLIEGYSGMAARAQSYYEGLVPGKVSVISCFARPDNINSLLEKSGSAGGLDLLSIDVDGFDYWLWEAVKDTAPSLVIIEYNARFGAEASFTIPYDPAFNRFHELTSGIYYGASLMALTRLGKRKGYDLVGCDSSAANAFFMRADLRSKTDLPALAPTAAHHQQPHYKNEDPVERFFKDIKGLPLVGIQE